MQDFAMTKVPGRSTWSIGVVSSDYKSNMSSNQTMKEYEGTKAFVERKKESSQYPQFIPM